MLPKQKIMVLTPLLVILYLCLAKLKFIIYDSQYELSLPQRRQKYIYTTKNKAYVCITGDLSKLELQSKIHNLLSPLHSAGYSIYIGLALSESSPNLFNESETIEYTLHKSITDVMSMLQSLPGVEQVNHFPPYYEDLRHKLNEITALYSSRVGKYGDGKLTGKLELAVKNSYQFKALRACNNWDELNVKTDFVVAVQDDALIHRIGLHNVIASVLNDNIIMTSDCHEKGSLNNLVMLAPSLYAHDFFSIPFEKYFEFDNLLRKIRRRPAEKLLRKVYDSYGFAHNSYPGIVVTQSFIKRKIDHESKSLKTKVNNCTVSSNLVSEENYYNMNSFTRNNVVNAFYHAPCWENRNMNIIRPRNDNIGQHTEPTPNKNAYICITGQLSRLELRNKIRHLLQPLFLLGYSLYIGLAMSDAPPKYSNDNSGARLALKNSLSDVLRELRSVNGVKHVKHIPPSFVDLKSNPKYDKFLGNYTKRDVNGAIIHDNYITNQPELAVNNARQFKTLQHCGHWAGIEKVVDVLVRIREDVLFQRVDLRHILRLVDGGAVVTSRCDQWHGINDKMAFAPSSRAVEFFNIPYDEYLTFDNDIHKTEHLNAEQLYKIAYERHGFNLTSTDSLAVTKAVTDFKPVSNRGSWNCTVSGNAYQHVITKNCPWASLDWLSYDDICWK